MFRHEPEIEFSGRGDNAGYLCEAFMAGQAARHDAEGHRWKGGSSLIDVSFNDQKVDVKRGFIESVRTSEGTIDCLGFMGANLSEKRSVQAREGVTAYAIVVPSREGSAVTTRRDGSIGIEMPAPESWYLVPSKSINNWFAPKLNRAGKPSGLNQYCSFYLAEQWKQALL